MEITINHVNQIPIAEVKSDQIIINEIQDAVNLIGNCTYQGSTKIILEKEKITPDFFDLKTKLAGEVLQKFSTYNMQLAIVGDFSSYTSKSLKEFIYESNKQGRILFVSSIEEAREKLAR